MNKTNFLRPLIVNIFFLTGSLCAAINPAFGMKDTYEKILPNGLKVIVKEDHRAPTAVHIVWYKTGSIDEVEGVTGVAHVLEHMMFKGTSKVAAGEFSKRVAQMGGRDNAFTHYDYTGYFQLIPRERLNDVMALEADRMHALKITDKEFEQEIKVVMEERRWRTDDQPHARVREALMAVALSAHPYRRPVIGWMDDLHKMTPQDARDWYARWYAPNNAVVLVVGDVSHQAVFDLAAKHYGSLRPHILPKRRETLEAPQQGIRRVTVKAEAELPYICMAWRAPVLAKANEPSDVYALDMLASVLDGYEGARLGRQLVKVDKRAISVNVNYDGIARGQQSLFVIDGVPAAGVSISDLEAAFRQQITKIAQEGVSESELVRAKAQVMASRIFGQDSLMGQTYEIGGLEMSNLSWHDEETLTQRLNAVTSQDIQRVAKQYFNDDSLTVAVLDPQPMRSVATKPTPPVGRHF